MVKNIKNLSQNLIKIESKWDELEKLRAEFIELTAAKDHLINIECQNIENSYMLALGRLEYQEFEKECLMRRLKRKLEIMQALKNRQKEIDDSAIEKALDEEFEEFQQMLNAQLGRVNDALLWCEGKELSEEEQGKLKKAYHEIVKALHPDLHLDLTEEQKELFNNAVIAYKNGDLRGITIIWEIASGFEIRNREITDEESFIREKQRIEEMISDVKVLMDKVKSVYPYNMKSLLNDKQALEKAQKDVRERISEYEEFIKEYREKIKNFLIPTRGMN